MDTLTVPKVPRLIRDPDSGRLIIDSKRGRKMPRRDQLRILAEMRAERVYVPSDDLPF